MSNTRTTQGATISIIPTGQDGPANKLADGEVHFEDGICEGLKLVGFAIWRRGDGLAVTFPARSYSVNGAKRTFTLLRAVNGNREAEQQLREEILAAYREQTAGSRRREQPTGERR